MRHSRYDRGMNRHLAPFVLALFATIAGFAGSAAAATVTFGPPTPSASSFYPSAPRQIGLAQGINTDSALDLYAAYGTFGSSTVQIRQTNQLGVWTSGGGGFLTIQNIATNNGPRDLALGDVNNDSFVDVAVASNGGVQLARNGGAGVYTAFASPAGTSFDVSTGVAFGLFNNDALPDMVVSTAGASLTDSIELYLNTGNSMAPFNAFTGTTIANDLVDVVVADFDGDGDRDVGTASTVDQRAYVSLNNSGTLASPVGITLFSRPGSVAAGDVNGDGRAELLVAEPDRGTVAVVSTGSLPTTLGPIARVATGYSPLHVATGDLDGDGKPEIVTANAASDSVTVATLGGTSANYPAGPNPVSVALGDLNADGRADIVVANESTLGVSTLANLGTPPVVPLPLPPATANLSCTRKTARKKTTRVSCSVKLANVNGATRYTARLVKRSKTLKTLRVAAGKRLDFKFPKGLAPGRYTVRLTVTATGGNVTASRSVTVPKSR